MSKRAMWVYAIHGCDDTHTTAFAVTSHDEGVASVALHEKLHTPESWAVLSADIARAIAIVCGPCIGDEVKS